MTKIATGRTMTEKDKLIEIKLCEYEMYYPHAPWSSDSSERRCGNCKHFFGESIYNWMDQKCPKCGYINVRRSINCECGGEFFPGSSTESFWKCIECGKELDAC